MTPYGDAPRLGDTIDPRLMAQDFSGFARAGAIKGQTLANLGQNIGDIIKVRGEQKKQDATNEKFLKQAVDVFKGTPLEESISAAYQNYTSEDTTDRERRAIGSSIRETIGLGMQAQDMKRQQELLNLKKAEIAGESKIMTLTPQQLDAYTNAGYSAEVVGINADGTMKVDVMKRKGAGGPGGFLPFENAETGVIGLQPAPPKSFDPTPSFGGAVPSGAGMPSAIPVSGITDATSGYATGPQLPPDVLQIPQGGGGMSDILLGGEIPPQQQQQFEDPSFLEVGANRVREMLSQPPRAYVVDEQVAIPQQEPQVPAVQPSPAPAPAPETGSTPPTAKRPLANPDIYTKPIPVWTDDGVEKVMYMPGSHEALLARQKELEIALKQQELKGDAAKDAKAELKRLKGAKLFSDEIAGLADAYAQLSKLGAAVGGGEPGSLQNITARLRNTGFGQFAETMLGTDAQVYREKVAMPKPTLINAIREATDMGSKQLDSDRELMFYLQSLSDTNKPLAANLKALLLIERRYGVGGRVEGVLKDNPALLQRIKRFDLEFKEMAEGDDPADIQGQAQDTTDFLNTYPATLE